MSHNSEDLKAEYRNEELRKEYVPDNPITLFEKWFNQALEISRYDTTAMHLATADDEGKPSIRVVLLKDYSDEGFVFYSNYNSRKGQDLKNNRFCSINFYWSFLMRQVRIDGKVEKTDQSRSDEYFNMSSEGGRIAAIASPQSKILASRDELIEKFRQVEQQGKNEPLVRPAHWGGYVVKPERIEFWQGRDNRYHDRIVYSLQKQGKWTCHRLAP